MAGAAVKSLCRDCLWTGPGAARRCPACASPRMVAHAELERLTMAHLDCDAFYASVEKRDRPELRDVPVIVGGSVRGVVATCCYIARISGVRSAMPMTQALRRCPQAVVLKPDFARYKAESRRIMAKMEALTPLVQPLSLDEAWMDLAGTERLNGGFPALVLARMQAEIEREIGLTVSIGLAANKFLAKIASDLDKPRGFSVIGGEEAQAFLAPRGVRILPGVGPKFAETLERAGYRTVGDLASAEPKELADRYGVHGLRLSQLSHGEDARVVDPDQERKGISSETTFNEDITARDGLEDELWPLCEKVARQARQAGVAGRVVTLKLKTTDFRIVTRRRTLPAATQTARTLFTVGRELLSGEVDGRSGGLAYRLIGIGISGLGEVDDAAADELFGDLFGGEETRARKGERAVDALRARFGQAAVVSARALKPADR